ncbi:hypothetical protein INT48_008754 [Thamnidium elegans]|uniref:Cysteine-rich transmembrane CYSTM domain-containing protein n=1 Tax=Thamnidium elegans TaxID=101142 RepID=A0A8H7VW25_9FUNG|nr:hypothetical protein INT48_008754 [Thamnidium elegans]
MNSNEPVPDRYYTPQQKKPEVNHAEAYQPTPRPESVYINENSRVAKNESCCLACLLACFLCVAVKGEDGKNAPK